MVKNTGRWDVFYSCPGSGKTTAALMVLQKLRKIIRGGPLGMMVIGVLKNSKAATLIIKRIHSAEPTPLSIPMSL
jgi:hypothetical protein